MRRLAAGLAALAVTGSSFLLGAGAAGAATSACINAGTHPPCAGVQSQQAVPLQLWTSGVAGSVVLAKTPAFTKAEDWIIHPGTDNGVSRIEWAPRGNLSGMCLTATLDVRRAPVRMEPCQSGVAGVSHQLWRHIEHADGSYAYINLANNLALAVAGDTPGAQVQVRSQHLASPNQRFDCTTSAP
jgi:hypothetical protein